MIARAKRAENSFQALNQPALASPVMLDALGILEPCLGGSDQQGKEVYKNYRDVMTEPISTAGAGGRVT